MGFLYKPYLKGKIENMHVKKCLLKSFPLLSVNLPVTKIAFASHSDKILIWKRQLKIYKRQMVKISFPP